MVLINAQTKRAEKLGHFSRYVPLYPPIGIGLLAAYLIDKGHQVRIWDDAIKMLTCQDLKGLLRNYQRPHLFGISCVSASIARGHRLARMIKEFSPDSVVIMGGIHPTVLPEDSLNTGVVDYVVRKEGEVPLECLCSALKNGADTQHLPGLSFRKDGKIIHNPARAGPEMDSLPAFPYHLFERQIDKYDFGFVLSSRGCPYECIFCSQRSITGRRVTSRSLEKVVEDMVLLVNKYRQRLITFIDDDMLSNKTRIKTLCELIIKKRLHKKTAFQCQVRGDAASEDILNSLKAANFVTLDFGLETASERLMAMLNKKETVGQNIQALQLAKKYGFKLSGTFILGLPGESKEERLECYRLAKRFLNFARFNNATPYPGTKLYEIAKSQNRLNLGRDWENLNACGTLAEGPFSKKSLAYVPLGMSEIDLKTDILKYNLLFSLRPSVIVNLLNRNSAASGWFQMPRHWLLSKEWFHLVRLVVNVTLSLLGLLILMVRVKFRRLEPS